MNDRQKKIGLIGTLVIGGSVILYLLGLLSQYFSKYNKWLTSGGMYGGTEMESVSFSPVECIRYMFSESGFKTLLIIILIGGGIFTWYKLHDKFRRGRDDDRGFKVSETGEYGTADEMDEETMKKVFEVKPVGMANGIILGEKNGMAVCMPLDTFLNCNIFVSGCSGSMKSRAIVRNYIFQIIKRGESAVVSDPKGEMYRDTAHIAKEKGYKVKVLNIKLPLHPENSDSFNCMAGLDGDSIMAQMLTNVIISNTTEGKTDHFWDSEEGGLLKGMMLMVSLDPKIPEEKKNLGTVSDIITKDSASIYERFVELDITHPAKAPLNIYFEASENVRTGALSGLGARLSVLQDDRVKQISNTNDIDLLLPGKEKCIYYLITSDQDQTMSFFSSLFFSLLFKKLYSYADFRVEQKLPVPVHMVLDEFNNIGRIGSSADGRDFAQILSTCRSRGIHILICVQNIGQVQDRYQGTLWASIVGNCDIQICLGSNDDITSKYFSEKSGEMTIDVLSTRVNRRTFAIAQIIPEYTETEGKGKRYVYTMNEVQTMDRSQMLVVTNGQQILKLNKLDYTKHPMSKEIKQLYVYAYVPERIQLLMAAAEAKRKAEEQKKNNGNKNQSDKRQSSTRKPKKSVAKLDGEKPANTRPSSNGNKQRNKKPDTETPVMIGSSKGNGSVRPTSGFDF
ncbi:MAG: type IV secretory system conjugative DNA transfer family protein [Oscillospiraceae bacterium]|nr:type IV secretory system conjugative DNA transfer family protein [Oscillospiraceae bacterium]